MAEERKEHDLQRIDDAVKSWRQGDCVIGEQWFVHRFDPNNPLSDEAKKVTEDSDKTADLAESEVLGFMVTSQSCDVVRSCAERPYVEVCPLVLVDRDRFDEIKRGRRPQFAYVPGVATEGLVADLDRVMTIEKSVVANWTVTPGCTNDLERRHLAAALTRKRARFAFPDDFVSLANRLQSHIVKKHGKEESPEGKGLRNLQEIRVRAAPSWNESTVEIHFWFILPKDKDTADEGTTWAELLEKWLNLVPSSGRFIKVTGQVVGLEDMKANDYVESDPLDLDHLSVGNT